MNNNRKNAYFVYENLHFAIQGQFSLNSNCLSSLSLYLLVLLIMMLVIVLVMSMPMTYNNNVIWFWLVQADLHLYCKAGDNLEIMILLIRFLRTEIINMCYGICDAKDQAWWPCIC